MKKKDLHTKYIKKFKGNILYGVNCFPSVSQLIASLLHKLSTDSVSKPHYFVYIPLTLPCLHFVLKQLILLHFHHWWFWSTALNFHFWAAFLYAVSVLSGKPNRKLAIMRFDVLMGGWILLSWLMIISVAVWQDAHSQPSLTRVGSNIGAL